MPAGTPAATLPASASSVGVLVGIGERGYRRCHARSTGQGDDPCGAVATVAPVGAPPPLLIAIVSPGIIGPCGSNVV